MSRKTVSAVVMSLLVLGTLALASDIQPVKAEGTIYIKPDGSIDPPTAPIQRNGDSYTLTDDITVNADDGIVIMRDNTVLDGSGYTLAGSGGSWGEGISWSEIENVTVQNVKVRAFYCGIYSTYSYGNKISENTITDVYVDGIWLFSSSNNSINGNNITNNLFGIWLNSSSNYNSISGNNIANNFDKGIALDSSSNNIVNGNNLTNNWTGIYLNSSSDNSFDENSIMDNGVGLMLDSSFNNNINGNSFDNNGLFVAGYSFGNVVSDNFVNGKPLVYLEGVSDAVVSDAGQVVLVQCNRIRVENSDLSTATIGVELWQTNSTEISGNNLTGNSPRGIYLCSSSDNNISGNNIRNNSLGIFLESSSNNTINGNNIAGSDPSDIYFTSSSENNISENNITNSDFGIMFDSSSNNTIEQNSFAGNSEDIVIRDSDGNTIRNNDLDNIITEGGLTGTGSQNKTVSCSEMGKYDSSLSDGILADGVAAIAGLTLSNSVDTKIIENAFSNAGIGISGSDFAHFTADVENNTVNGKPLCYYRGQDDLTISENLGQLIIVDCRNVTIEDVDISHTDFGVQICYSSDVTIINSVITDCQYGIGILSTTNTVISGNTIANNTVGLLVETGDFLGNTVYHNNFVNNLFQTSYGETASNCVWDNGCEGNFWGNYNGMDLDNDGVGDTYLPWEGVDNFPLMNIYWNPCDINHDLKVDMNDIGAAARAFNTVAGDILWNPHADITGPTKLVPDGKVNMMDIGWIARHFGENYS